MLLYVDKKKIKRRRIRILIAVVCLFVVLVLNMFHYKSVLYNGKFFLTGYKTLEYRNLWYDETGAILLFRSQRKGAPYVVVMPKDFSRENAELLAHVLVRIENKSGNVLIMPDLSQNKKLNEFVQMVLPDSEIVDKGGDVVLSSEIAAVQSFIYKYHLVPHGYSYKGLKKKANGTNVERLLDLLFPLRAKPVSKIEKEKVALQAFWNDNKEKIYQIVLGEGELNFIDKGLLLEKVRFCVQVSDDMVCDVPKGQSLLKRLTEMLDESNDKKPVRKLIFLTSDEEVENIDTISLDEDEGLYFRYKQRETYLLPQDIQALTDKKDFGAILRLKAGLNPNFVAPEMKFYKFKTMEGLIDEKI